MLSCCPGWQLLSVGEKPEEQDQTGTKGGKGERGEGSRRCRRLTSGGLAINLIKGG